MKDKKQYALENKLWIDEIGKSEDVLKLANGVLYKVIQSGDGSKHPTPQSVITAHYTGKTIDGKVFDSSKGGAPLAIRLSELIDGWIIALQNMTIGDKWEIYIPAEMGYGKYSQPGIPAYSTLIFEIELLGIFYSLRLCTKQNFHYQRKDAAVT